MGFKLPPGTAPMEQELEYLLYDLCVKWGFCIPPVSAERICKMTELTAEIFAASVVEVEGLNPQYERMYVQRIAMKFQERFGQDHISTDTFVDRMRGNKENWTM
jgi:hypothetical protein